jgi:glutathione peroxidase-family protein
MIEFQKKYADKGFTVLGVAMDDEGASVVNPFIAKEKFDVDGQSLAINYPIALGNDDLGAKFGGVLGLPTSYLITRDGKVATRIVGIVSEEHLDKAIQSAL